MNEVFVDDYYLSFVMTIGASVIGGLLLPLFHKNITPNNLADADGYIFGFPTRFGMIEEQFKTFLNTQGVEINHSVVHHGLIYVHIGLTFEAGMFEMVQVKGGSPYCAGIFRELGRAFHQGKYIAGIAKKLK
ncbi:hypothetical protein MKX03_015981 [Papaver bracteatum]|nr:hypothetical protein MKX03_015981 [Papaver bracteatum]